MSAGSLASATSTRVDSASKHIQPCRVNTDFLESLLDGFCDSPAMELQNNKMRYCMAKDEVVVGLGRPLYGTSNLTTRAKAYPPVTTTLARINQYSLNWMVLHNFMTSFRGQWDPIKDGLIQALQHKNPAQMEKPAEQDTMGNVVYEFAQGIAGMDQRTREVVVNQISNMLNLHFVGISLGLAYAHPNSGDTVASVMIGGLRTVRNGAFPMHSNDKVMFYSPAEQEFFEDNGGRINRDSAQPNGTPGFHDKNMFAAIFMDGKKGLLECYSHDDSQLFPTKRELQRQTFFDRGNSNFKGSGDQKINTFLLKPLIESRHKEKDGRPQQFPCDVARIVGRAISNAQPWEMVDIQLSRQAI